MALVAFAGSRSLAGREVENLVRSLVGSVVRAGRQIAVGCAVGADQMALEAALANGAKPTVFAAFGSDGYGSWKGSAVATVRKAARTLENSGGKIHWWAGGGRFVPLTQRLSRRTLAMVAEVAASGPGNGLVAFLTPDSKGTLLTIREAVRLEVPVVVFLVAGAQLPTVQGGSWQPAGKGVWQSGFRFVPGQ